MAPSPNSYDLGVGKTPGETLNYTRREKSGSRELRARLNTLSPTVQRGIKSLPGDRTRPCTEERLKSLGLRRLLGRRESNHNGQSLPDPKDRIQAYELHLGCNCLTVTWKHEKTPWKN